MVRGQWKELATAPTCAYLREEGGVCVQDLRGCSRLQRHGNRSKVVDTMAAVCSEGEGASHLGHHGGQLPERRAGAAGQPLQCVLEG